MIDAGWFEASDRHAVSLYRWEPDDPAVARGIIHIAHGMGEHAARYGWVAERLVEQGYIVSANDHRGHGRTATTLGDFGDDGWNRALRDTREIIDAHRDRWSDKPLILLGHSMGSMLAQQYITMAGHTIDAVALSGSPGHPGFLQSVVVRLLVRFERWRLGPKAESPLLQSVIFGSANKAFEEDCDEPTGFEWLSRDAAQVRQYVEDPLCGFVPCTGSLAEIFGGSHAAQKRPAISGIPPSLPMYVFAGTADPVNNDLKNIERMLDRFRDQGIDITTRFYPEGRHEMFNETNRDEVMTDLVDWLAGLTATP